MCTGKGGRWGKGEGGGGGGGGVLAPSASETPLTLWPCWKQKTCNQCPSRKIRRSVVGWTALLQTVGAMQAICRGNMTLVSPCGQQHQTCKVQGNWHTGRPGVPALKAGEVPAPPPAGDPVQLPGFTQRR